MGSGGGRGGYGGSTESSPWPVQGDYLKELFPRGFQLVTGQKREEAGGGEIDPMENFSDAAARLNYFGDIRKTPQKSELGKITYSSRPDLGGGVDNSPYWDPQEVIGTGGGNSGVADPSVPTLAQFTPYQIAAQQAMVNKAGEGLGAGSLESLSENTLRSILSGGKAIIPQGFDAAAVSPFREVGIPQIQSLKSMIDSGITSPNIATSSMGASSVDPTALDYQYRPELNRVTGGNYLYGESNPYLEGMYDSATRNVINQFNRNVLPSIDQSAQAAGRYGSGAWADLRSQANQDLLNTLGDVSSNMYGGAYESERGRMMQGLGLGGQLSEADLQAQLQRNIQNAGFGQEAGQTNAQLGQQRNIRQAELGQDLLGQQLGLGLQRATTQAGLETQVPLALSEQDLQKAMQNAQMTQEERQFNAQANQDAQSQNIANLMSSLGITPTITDLDDANIGRYAQVGAEQQDYNQQLINGLIGRQEFNNQEIYNRLGLLADIIGGNFGSTTQSISSAERGGK